MDEVHGLRCRGSSSMDHCDLLRGGYDIVEALREEGLYVMVYILGVRFIAEYTSEYIL